MPEKIHFPSQERKRVQSFQWNGLKDEHFMQCFQEDDALVQAVGLFIQQALVEGDAGIVVGTPTHRAGVEGFLRTEGLDPTKLQRSGRYIPLDAQETLDRICVGGRPNGQKFFEVIGMLISRASNSWGRVRAFGEMVNLLWLQGKKAEAVELEGLWNELAKIYPFALFCAYSREAINDECGAFLQVCKAHSMVIL